MYGLSNNMRTVSGLIRNLVINCIATLLIILAKLDSLLLESY